ncbi:MAG TPA: amidohydrolase family protein [Chloroflexota bacterium]|nr:amidohydrolase family protein [Chloroflexota bacterium]
MPLVVNDSPLPAIDAHTHIGRRLGPLGHGVASFLGEDLVRDLDEVGLDRAVAFPLGAPYTDYSESNRIMAEEVAKFPDRIIGFCRINPNFGPEASAAALEHCLGTLGLRGIKLHPEIEFFDPNDESLLEPVYEAARRYGVPLIFHTGMSSKAAPAVIAELAARYPDVPVILGHMGVSEYVKQAVAMARQHENVYLETSVVGWMPLILEAIGRVGTSKLLYGSDHPYNPLPMEVEKMAKHVARAAALTETDLRNVFAANLLSLFRSDTQSAPR